MSKNVKNELRKLAATYFNNIAVACAVLGLIGPLVAGKLAQLGIGEHSTLQQLTRREFIRYEIGIWLLSVVFHMIARVQLWFLED
jgi:hypothetical protein